jgi:teichuronic acid biosynthesis glycosyltransferase TuaH
MSLDLVVCSLEDWDEVWRRNQFLVREMMRADTELRVLFVEPAADVLHAIRRRRPVATTGLRELEPGRLWALKPRKIWPRVAGPWADRSLMQQLRHAIAAVGFGAPTLWINDTRRLARGDDNTARTDSASSARAAHP